MTTILIPLSLMAVVHVPPLVMLREHPRWGFEPFFAYIGAIQLLQVVSAYFILPIGSYLKVSLGSAFLYPWTLGGVLFARTLGGPAESRRLTYSLLGANAAVSIILTLSSLLLKAGFMETGPSSPAPTSAHEAFVLFWGTFLLYLESLLVTIVFELFRAATRSFRLQIFGTLGGLLVLDSFLFPAVAFASVGVYHPLFLGNLLGKVSQAFVISLLAPFIMNLEPLQPTTPLPFRPTLRFLLFDLDLQQLLTESYKDPLTKLWNRRYFEGALAHEWSRAVRSKSPLAFMTIDLDYLKTLNDTYGHAAGDHALRSIAESIREVARRESDCAARLGGDEFVLLLPNTSEADAEKLAQQLVERVGSKTLPNPWHGVVRLSVSIGLAVTVPDLTITPQYLLHASDEALYQAKQKGRACWVLADSERLK
ncbi:MAG: GGDEF domain-containing protein, partial [Thermoanaerobaculum sp.]